jgi:hypothetical protein
MATFVNTHSNPVQTGTLTATWSCVGAPDRALPGADHLALAWRRMR